MADTLEGLRARVKAALHPPAGEVCPTCAPREGEVNHPPGMIFVGWGHGWQLCSNCGGTRRVLPPAPDFKQLTVDLLAVVDNQAEQVEDLDLDADLMHDHHRRACRQLARALYGPEREAEDWDLADLVSEAVRRLGAG